MTPVSTFTDAAETQSVTADVRDDFVGDEGAAGSLIANGRCINAIRVAEVVDGEWFIPVIDELDHFTNILEGKDGHDWSENLLSHQLGVQIGLQDDSWFDVTHIFIHFTAANKRATRPIDKFFDSICVEVIDHFSLVLGALGLALTIHLLESELDALNKIFHLRLVHKNIVRRDADLTRVESFPEGGLCRGEIYLCIVVHNHWALSTQLKDARGQVLRSRLSDKFTNLGRACEANQVEGQLIQRHSDINAALDADDMLGVKIRVTELFDHGTGLHTDL